MKKKLQKTWSLKEIKSRIEKMKKKYLLNKKFFRKVKSEKLEENQNVKKFKL